MRRLGPEQLQALALDAIEEAAAASHVAPVERTKGLALALAWLLHCSRPDRELPRWPFKSFCEGLTNAKEHDRWSAVNAAANAIYGTLELRRDPARISHFEAGVAGLRKAAASRSARKVG
jgi:hypothetical protein